MLLGSRCTSTATAPFHSAIFVEGRLVPGGEYYASSYMVGSPGAAFEYSSYGFALLGYLVESISGIPFDDYTRLSIFEPLGMNSTGWHLADLGSAPIAMPYRCNNNSSDGKSAFVCHPLGQYGYPDYPDGSLRTSASQLARFLGAIMNGGELEGVRILQDSTVQAMLTPNGPPAPPACGLGWRMLSYDGESYWGHYGGDRGVTTIMNFRPSDGTGVIILANGNYDGMPALFAVEQRLFEEAERFADAEETLTQVAGEAEGGSRKPCLPNHRRRADRSAGPAAMVASHLSVDRIQQRRSAMNPSKRVQLFVLCIMAVALLAATPALSGVNRRLDFAASAELTAVVGGEPSASGRDGESADIRGAGDRRLGMTAS